MLCPSLAGLPAGSLRTQLRLMDSSGDVCALLCGECELAVRLCALLLMHIILQPFE